MIELHDLTRLPLDANGNSRHVVHFPTFLTKEENSSNFLLWAGLLYSLALMRAAPMGGRKYNGKSFGGGIKFQAQEGQMQRLAEQAFASFENSKVFKDSQMLVWAVEEDAEYKHKCLTAMIAVRDSQMRPKVAFAEVFAQCQSAKEDLRGNRMSQEAIWLAAVYVSMELYEEVKCK